MKKDMADRDGFYTPRNLCAWLSIFLLGSSGCISHNYGGLARSQEVESYHPVPLVQRNRVYIFALSDLNPWHMQQVSRWQKQWQEAGYTKIASGQVPFHLGWMKHQMREIRSEVADAVFVVVLHSSARSSAERWIQECQSEGLPIAQVVVVANEKPSLSGTEYHADPLVIDDSLHGHAHLIALLHALARDRGAADGTRQTSSSWHYPFAPPLRPAGDPQRFPQWSFLFDDRLSADSPSFLGKPPFDNTSSISRDRTLIAPKLPTR